MKDVKDEIIKDLEEKLEMERSVKMSEVDLNADYKKHIINLETRIIALGKLITMFRMPFVERFTRFKFFKS
jgi:hypothetical protein